ncbi:hypothetical protein HYV80_02320 [Candidatus Woesearchaeota archaeon]|nr:hypothetical protein [Candidatus Woesearchaeota archaeon]
MAKSKIGIAIYSALILLFVLLSADFYLSKKYYVPSSDAFLADPSRYAGKEAEFAGSFVKSTTGSFYLESNQKVLKVHYPDLEKPAMGQIYVRVRLNADGTATALEVHKMQYNYLKYVLSFFAFMIFLYIFFREWKLREWRLVENA